MQSTEDDQRWGKKLQFWLKTISKKLNNELKCLIADPQTKSEVFVHIINVVYPLHTFKHAAMLTVAAGVYIKTKYEDGRVPQQLVVRKKLRLSDNFESQRKKSMQLQQQRLVINLLVSERLEREKSCATKSFRRDSTATHILIIIVLVPASSQRISIRPKRPVLGCPCSYYSPHFWLFFLWASLLFFGDYVHFFCVWNFDVVPSLQSTLVRLWSTWSYG